MSFASYGNFNAQSQPEGQQPQGFFNYGAFLSSNAEQQPAVAPVQPTYFIPQAQEAQPQPAPVPAQSAPPPPPSAPPQNPGSAFQPTGSAFQRYPSYAQQKTQPQPQQQEVYGQQYQQGNDQQAAYAYQQQAYQPGHVDQQYVQQQQYDSQQHVQQQQYDGQQHVQQQQYDSQQQYYVPQPQQYNAADQQQFYQQDYYAQQAQAQDVYAQQQQQEQYRQQQYSFDSGASQQSKQQSEGPASSVQEEGWGWGEEETGGRESTSLEEESREEELDDDDHNRLIGYYGDSTVDEGDATLGAVVLEEQEEGGGYLQPAPDVVPQQIVPPTSTNAVYPPGMEYQQQQYPLEQQQVAPPAGQMEDILLEDSREASGSQAEGAAASFLPASLGQFAAGVSAFLGGSEEAAAPQSLENAPIESLSLGEVRTTSRPPTQPAPVDVVPSHEESPPAEPLQPSSSMPPVAHHLHAVMPQPSADFDYAQMQESAPSPSAIPEEPRAASHQNLMNSDAVVSSSTPIPYPSLPAEDCGVSPSVPYDDQTVPSAPSQPPQRQDMQLRSALHAPPEVPSSSSSVADPPIPREGDPTFRGSVVEADFVREAVNMGTPRLESPAIPTSQAAPQPPSLPQASSEQPPDEPQSTRAPVLCTVMATEAMTVAQPSIAAVMTSTGYRQEVTPSVPTAAPVQPPQRSLLPAVPQQPSLAPSVPDQPQPRQPSIVPDAPSPPGANEAAASTSVKPPVVPLSVSTTLATDTESLVSGMDSPHRRGSARQEVGVTERWKQTQERHKERLAKPAIPVVQRERRSQLLVTAADSHNSPSSPSQRRRLRREREKRTADNSSPAVTASLLTPSEPAASLLVSPAAEPQNSTPKEEPGRGATGPADRSTPAQRRVSPNLSAIAPPVRPQSNESAEAQRKGRRDRREQLQQQNPNDSSVSNSDENKENSKQRRGILANRSLQNGSAKNGERRREPEGDRRRGEDDRDNDRDRGERRADRSDRRGRDYDRDDYYERERLGSDREYSDRRDFRRRADSRASARSEFVYSRGREPQHEDDRRRYGGRRDRPRSAAQRDPYGYSGSEDRDSEDDIDDYYSEYGGRRREERYERSTAYGAMYGGGGGAFYGRTAPTDPFFDHWDYFCRQFMARQGQIPTVSQYAKWRQNLAGQSMDQSSLSSGARSGPTGAAVPTAPLLGLKQQAALLQQQQALQVQQRPVQQQQQRAVEPNLYHRSHCFAKIAFADTILMLRYTGREMPRHLEQRSLRACIQNEDCTLMLDQLAAFPGPLVKGSVHKIDIVQWCDRKARECLSGEGPNGSRRIDVDSHHLLWTFLAMMLRQNGLVTGSDVAQLLLQDRLCDEDDDVEVWRERLGSDAGRRRYTSEEAEEEEEEGRVKVDSSRVSSQTQTSDRALQTFTDKMMIGNVKDALDYAVKAGLWGHALFLALNLDERTHRRTMIEFANSVARDHPLQTAYQLLSRQRPACTVVLPSRHFSAWRQHLAMILANAQPSEPVHGESLLAMAATLRSNDRLQAAHFCFLVAHVLYSGIDVFASDGGVRLVGLEAEPTQQLMFDDIDCLLAFQCTEIFEYAWSLSIRDGSSSIVALQEYKFMYALLLADWSMSEKAYLYFQAIGNEMERRPYDYTVEFMLRVYDYGLRLQNFDPTYGGDTTQTPEWLTHLYGVITAMIQHYSNQQAPSAQPAFYQEDPEEPLVLSDQENVAQQQELFGSQSHYVAPPGVGHPGPASPVSRSRVSSVTSAGAARPPGHHAVAQLPSDQRSSRSSMAMVGRRDSHGQPPTLPSSHEPSPVRRLPDLSEQNGTQNHYGYHPEDGSQSEQHYDYQQQQQQMDLAASYPQYAQQQQQPVDRRFSGQRQSHSSSLADPMDLNASMRGSQQLHGQGQDVYHPQQPYQQHQLQHADPYSTPQHQHIQARSSNTGGSEPDSVFGSPPESQHEGDDAQRAAHQQHLQQQPDILRSKSFIESFGIGGILSGVRNYVAEKFPQPGSNQMKLGESNRLVYDSTKGRWLDPNNPDEGEDIPPPPPSMGMGLGAPKMQGGPSQQHGGPQQQHAGPPQQHSGPQQGGPPPQQFPQGGGQQQHSPIQQKSSVSRPTHPVVEPAPSNASQQQAPPLPSGPSIHKRAGLSRYATSGVPTAPTNSQSPPPVVPEAIPTPPAGGGFFMPAPAPASEEDASFSMFSVAAPVEQQQPNSEMAAAH